MPINYTLALLCALLYAIGALCIKRAIEHGAGITRIMFISQWIVLICVLPLLLTNPEVSNWAAWWAPATAGLAEFIGFVMVMLVIREGGITIQTPILGTKVIFVAGFSLMLLSYPIPISWWFSAVLSLIGVLVITMPDLIKHNLPIKIFVYALCSSLVFAFADVIIEREAPGFGETAFLLIAIATVAFCTLSLIPFFRASLFELPKKSWPWTLLGSLFMAAQEVGIIYALSFYGKATVVNVLYSTRGVISILLVWIIGHWFGSSEQHLGYKVLGRRLIGAFLILGAIIVVLV